MVVEMEKYKFIIPHARTYTKGVIGCPARAVRSPARYQVVHCGYVWFSSSHILPDSFHSSAPLHPAHLRLLNFTFPREPGWLHTRMVQGPMCQTLKTHYWTQGLCRGPEALGKGSSAVGEGFAEGSPR